MQNAMRMVIIKTSSTEVPSSNRVVAGRNITPPPTGRFGLLAMHTTGMPHLIKYRWGSSVNQALPLVATCCFTPKRSKCGDADGLSQLPLTYYTRNEVPVIVNSPALNPPFHWFAKNPRSPETNPWVIPFT